jgi:hypothetical protein
MTHVSFPQTFAGPSRFALHPGFRPQTPGAEQPETGAFGVRGCQRTLGRLLASLRPDAEHALRQAGFLLNEQ